MFELSVALKYLTPRWRQLSVSIISIISILVIALVVWLIVVFFSVTHGLEKSWIQKLIALTAPVRITPTQNYYNSYYYKIDTLSESSDYSTKTIGEKLKAKKTDPYDPLSDEEVPLTWPKPDRAPNGELKDLARIALQEVQKIQGVPGLRASDYEMTAANLRIKLLRTVASDSPIKLHFGKSQSYLNQAAYLGSLDSDNPALLKALISYSPADLSNLLEMTAIASDTAQDDRAPALDFLPPEASKHYLKAFFNGVTVDELKTPKSGWLIPQALRPKHGKVAAAAILRGEQPVKILIPADPNEIKALASEAEIGTLEFSNEGLKFSANGKNFELLPHIPLQLIGGIAFPAVLDSASLENAFTAAELKFHVKMRLQGVELQGLIPYRQLQIAKASVNSQSDSKDPLWFYERSGRFFLPANKAFGEGILLPRAFKEAGILLGDRGYLSYYAPTTSTVQEQRIKVFVAGFYDPGIIPIGGKLIIANPEVTNLIRASHNQDDTSVSNGINVRMDRIEQAEEVKLKLQKAFAEAGIAPYWKIETYQEYDFTRDIIQQLHSDKTLFTLISTVIIIVACSNIISMLIILVNDKKVEIGILRSMGASSASIAAIFGICGIVMGVTGSLIGTLAAVLTLNHIDMLVKFLSAIQGHNAFNPIFYGEALPNEVSFEALLFVIAATALISLIAGIVPAVKACLMRPSTILRSE